MDSEEHKPFFYNALRWLIMASILLSIAWLAFSYVYADTYVKNREERKAIEATQKFRNRFAKEKSDPMSVLEPKKLANLIRGGAIVGIVLQLLFLFGIKTDNTYLATTFIIWAFLCTVLAFKLALRDAVFWFPGCGCLGIGVLSCFYVHFLFQVK